MAAALLFSEPDAHWNDPPPGETPHCPDCGTPLAWDSPSIFCPRHGGVHWSDQYEPEDEPDMGGRMYR